MAAQFSVDPRRFNPRSRLPKTMPDLNWIFPDAYETLIADSALLFGRASHYFIGMLLFFGISNEPEVKLDWVMTQADVNRAKKILTRRL